MTKRMVMVACVTSALWAGMSTAAPAPAQLTAEQAQFFEKKIRPLLTANCYKCHSAEQGKSKGDLTLDSREGVMRGGKGGAIVTPGDPAHSRLIAAVTYADPDLQMPPKGEKLSAGEIADLTAWVKMGAPDPRVTPAGGGAKLTGLNDKARSHWAYRPVKMPAVPAVKDAGWVRSPVDAFVLAKLEQNGMRPSPPAAREALIRRATFDLIGLPPTPEEVAAFVGDSSADAFEKVVDRLLASPHYGERWGRFWLDSARYSDTSGLDQGNRREDYRYAHAWTYRDYVVGAFNADKPYDQFLIEQVAADKLPGADKDPARLAALGFLTVGKRFVNPNDTIDERIDALGKATLGLTVACARCHDHKFDPIPTADYYSLHGIFASTVEPAEKPMIGPAPAGPEFDDYQAKLAALEKKNHDIYFDLLEQKGNEFRRKADAYLLVGLYFRKDQRDDVLARNKLIAARNLDRDIYQQFRTTRPKDEAVFGPLVKFAELPADTFAAKAKDVLEQVASGRMGRRPLNPLVAAAFKDVAAEELHSLADVAAVYGKLFRSIEPQAKAYIQASRTASGRTVPGFDAALVELIEIPAKVESVATLDFEHMKTAARLLPQQNNRLYQRFAFDEINELQLTHPGAPARAMVVADAPQIRNSPIFIRGEAQNRGPVVPHRFLEVLSGPSRAAFTGGSGRLELARAIASKDNPLTARVMVNRIWMHHFGEAFVRTPDDLGVQSEPPSHPELLDYLAARFSSSSGDAGLGWSMKKMHRLIMLSSAYQQSSETNPAYAQKDPDNRLLWRANLRRLDFEAIRDSMLLFTGKLDETIGGKPVNLTDEPYSNRRSVYGYIDRGGVPEVMAQFDFSDPDMTNSKRTTTIVPQQALFFMNSPMSVDVARKVTSRPEFEEAKDDEGRVAAIYQTLFQRAPRPEEIRFATEFLAARGVGEGGGAQVAAAKVANGRASILAARRAAMKQPVKRKLNGRQAIQNEGERVERRPLTVWEQYAQALLFTNEMAYVN